MKTNILKKCACLLLIGGLFVPIHQIKADEIKKTREEINKEIATGLAGIFILALLSAGNRPAQPISKNEAHEIILNFFNAEQRKIITSRQLSHALGKFGMPYFETAFFVLNQRPDKAYKAIQRTLNRLPEDLQELFKAISEEEFCENIKQLKKETFAKEQEAATTEEVATTETSTEVCNETVSA